jgi:phosphate transport system protein
VPLRLEFVAALDRLRESTVLLVSLIARVITDATNALVDDDVRLAKRVLERGGLIHAATDDLEAEITDLLARQQPVARDLRTLIASLRMVAALDRMGDLAIHLAEIVVVREPDRVVPESMQDVVRRMGELDAALCTKVGWALYSDDEKLAADCDRDDDEVDRLYREVLQRLGDPDWDEGIRAGVDLAVAARFFERFADQAVTVARRLVYARTGELP